MLNREFFFWICGYLELCGNSQFTQRQWEVVMNHFKLMLKVTSYRPSVTAINLINDENFEWMCRSQIENVRPTEAEIMYYIQGFYEISGFEGKLNKVQKKKIVELFMFNNEGISPAGIEVFVEVGNNGDPRELLKALFQHVIDNSYNLTEEEMFEAQMIHDGPEE